MALSRGNGLISTTGSKANVTGDELSQLSAATACAPPLLIFAAGSHGYEDNFEIKEKEAQIKNNKNILNDVNKNKLRKENI